MEDVKKAYFPPSYGKPECSKCEREGCISRGKYQRDRMDFTYTSGRCPRLPDRRGFVYPDDRKLYGETLPLVHVERGEGDVLYLTLTQPGKRQKRVYMTWGQWWFRDTVDGNPVRRVISIEDVYSKKSLLETMDQTRSDYSIFRCRIEDSFII